MVPQKSQTLDGVNSIQNLILSKRTNFGEKSGANTPAVMNNSFDMFQSQRSDAKLKNELTSGKLGQRVHSHSLVERDPQRLIELRKRNNTVTSSLSRENFNDKKSDQINR